MKEAIHLDLFSGIGLFSYAADLVWNLEHVFCEIEDWPYRFLKQEYPNARIERDIKTFDGTEYAGRTFLLTAGVPCQPASVAGKRKGTEDDRWLWPEALRVMAEAQPQWCIFENPLGILTLEKGLVFENLVLEMESQGYAIQPYIIPAGSVGAIHRRYRVWIVARNTNGNSINSKRGIQKRPDTESGGGNSNASNPRIKESGRLSSSGRQAISEIRESSWDIADTKKTKRDYWQKPWPEVAIKSCIRGVDVSFADGIYKAEKFEKGERIKRLEALGNTIQWEVATAIMQGQQQMKHVLVAGDLPLKAI